MVTGDISNHYIYVSNRATPLLLKYIIHFKKYADGGGGGGDNDDKRFPLYRVASVQTIILLMAFVEQWDWHKMVCKQIWFSGMLPQLLLCFGK